MEVKDLKNTCTTVEIADLEDIGWDFYKDYKEISKAQEISLEQAEDFLKRSYYLVIEVTDNFKTYEWKEHKQINEVSDKNATGDDKKTLQNLIDLHKAEQIINFENL